MNALKKAAVTIAIACLAATTFFIATTSHGEPKKSSALKIHPKVFSLVDCWISDSERPVVTEINLDAVDKNGNEFNDDGVVQDGEWTKAPGENSGFLRYRVLSAKGNQYRVEYQENGGGSLTTSCEIGFSIDHREIRVDGKSASVRILRILSISSMRRS